MKRQIRTAISNDEAVYELYAKWLFKYRGYAEEFIDEFSNEEDALKALHAEIELVIKAYEMKKPDSHWRFNDQTDANKFRSPTWTAGRGQEEYYHLGIRKVK